MELVKTNLFGKKMTFLILPIDSTLPQEIELKQFPIDPLIIENTPFQEEEIIQDVERLAEKIHEIFTNTILTKDQRHECFSLIDKLRKKINICPSAEYMHREVFLRQAENILNKNSVIKDEKNLLELTPLAEKYVQGFKNFQNMMKKTVIEYVELFNNLQSLSEAHLLFSSRFSKIFVNSNL